MEFETYTLPNGIRGIHRQVKSNVAHCALIVGAGSRDGGVSDPYHNVLKRAPCGALFFLPGNGEFSQIGRAHV